MSFYRQIFLVFLLANVINVAHQTVIGYANCGSTGTLTDVAIEGCTEVPCELTKGTNVSVQITFSVAKPVKSLVTNVFGIIAKAEVPFKGVNSDSCLTVFDPSGKAGCPLQPNINYVYRNAFEVKKFYPSLDVTVKWILRDGESKETTVCFTVEATLL